MAEKSKVFWFTKYCLMASNAFGIMLGIFVVLFGISYPEEVFPGGYKGKTTALISVVMIFFTLIGYCGAHHQKAYFLIVYSIIILFFISSNVVTFLVMPKYSVFNPEGKTFGVVTVIMVLVLMFACLFAYQVRNMHNSMQMSNNNNNCNFNNGANIGLKSRGGNGQIVSHHQSVSYGPPHRYSSAQSNF